MAGDPFDDNPEIHSADRARLGYLTGERRDVSLDPFDQAELDKLMATLAHPSTWDDPPPGLGDRIVQLITDEAIAGETLAGPVVRTVSDIAAPRVRTTSPRSSSASRRRFAWVGPAVLGAAAAALVAVAVTRVGSDEPEISADATIDLVGTELAPGVAGSAEVEAVQSGLKIHLELPGLTRRDGNDFYEAWLRSDDGTGLIPIGTFHDGDDVTLWAGVELKNFPIITVTRESKAAPKAPEQGSSGEVVASGRVAP